MHLVHLTASTFFGGPERQMLGLGRALPDDFTSTYLSFSEGGRCAAFLGQVRSAGFDGIELENDSPRLRSSIRELTSLLRERGSDVLITHGYKSNLLGRVAARRVGIPVVAVSRGWTGENVKVRFYDALDRFHLRYMDAVVCVSEGQAAKVRKAGVPPRKMTVIRNAARLDAFQSPLPEYRERLRQLARAEGDDLVIAAAGRLSPEKGFAVLLEAAALVTRAERGCRFVLFGEGGERPALEQRITELGLHDGFTLAGFRDDLDRWLPWADLAVLPSFTEGLPNVALEASAAGVPVVATAVGGTPEVVSDGATGFLVPSGDPTALASRILDVCRDATLRERLGEAGREFMRQQFSFEGQALAYRKLFAALRPRSRVAA
jgi:glycosyltransferase involved in cell wall biosynthesis